MIFMIPVYFHALYCALVHSYACYNIHRRMQSCAENELAEFSSEVLWRMVVQLKCFSFFCAFQGPFTQTAAGLLCKMEADGTVSFVASAVLLSSRRM